MSPTSPHQGIDLHLETGRAVLHGNATLRSTFSNRGALWSRSWSCERAASRATEKNIVICCSFMFQIRHPSVSWAPFEHFVAPSCVYPVYWGELFFYIALVMQSSLDKSAFAYLSTATNCITYSLACVSEMSLKQPVLFSCLYCLARIEILFSCCSCQLFGAWFYTLNHNKLHNLKQNNIGCSVLWQLKKKKKA